MEGAAAPGRHTRQRWFGRDGQLILLLILAAGLRTLVVWRTEVISRDSIVFIDYALQLENRPWTDVLKDNQQHPGYPLTVLAISLPVRYCLGTTDCWTMQLSAQLAAALAGWLLVIPMFYLGRELFDRGVGFWGALLFQCLPVSGRILSEALSEPQFLLLVASALLLAVRGLRSGSALRLAGCGLCTGLAYLTRPEGAVVAVALALLLFVMQCVPMWRRGWTWTVRQVFAVAASVLVVAGPYILITHHLTNKPSEGVVKRRLLALVPPSDPVVVGQPRRAAPMPVAGADHCLLAVWVDTEASYPRRLGRGLLAVVSELAKGLFYIAWLPALAGVVWHWHRLARRPEAWLLLLLCLVHTFILWRLAMVAGYVSERHVLLLVLCGIFPAVAGLRELPSHLATWWQRRADLGRRRFLGHTPLWSVLLLLAMAGVGLPKTLQPIHGNRIGHRQAGRWLAAHAQPSDEIHDGHFGWAHYYAGRLWIHGQPAVPSPDGWRTLYIVKGRSRERPNPYGPTNANADLTLANIRAAGGTIVYHWPENVRPERADAVVWRVRLRPASAPAR